MSILLETSNLKKHFESNGGFWGKKKSVKAVNGINLKIFEGETLSLVGESGCGKSTTGRLIGSLITPSEGEIIFNGITVNNLGKEKIRLLRRDIQFIFQDPFSSLNPKKTIKQILLDPLIIHKIGTRAEREKRVNDVIESVGLSQKQLQRYPHEFSGGQRQRISIARSLMLKPKLIIADEPVSALDVSIQAQILNLLKELQKEYNLTYLFISHDLSVVKHVSDRVAVMYLGKIIEMADKNDIYKNPKHPYTKALLSSVPIPDPDVQRERIILKGDLPSPTNIPSGCPFHSRCPISTDKCRVDIPKQHHSENNHIYYCYNVPS
ncbi:ABC transporter ATP-binding protein [Terrilactibacillus laevilacticus]|uniref:ABC transporter ATP-binding protein n=1 Tax=Terrilactibacillus laevilacticus TaxID=1380157 RepID=A0ABW5PN33_9BACI|nr:dipeptide ABC transporter ATP-binding protein [Terrilactibacillus laevilacticus]